MTKTTKPAWAEFLESLDDESAVLWDLLIEQGIEPKVAMRAVKVIHKTWRKEAERWCPRRPTPSNILSSELIDQYIRNLMLDRVPYRREYYEQWLLEEDAVDSPQPRVRFVRTPRKRTLGLPRGGELTEGHIDELPGEDN